MSGNFPASLPTTKRRPCSSTAAFDRSKDAIAVAEKNHKGTISPSTSDVTVADADMITLADALLQRIKSLPREHYLALRDRQYQAADQDLDTLNDLAEQLGDLLQDVAK